MKSRSREAAPVLIVLSLALGAALLAGVRNLGLLANTLQVAAGAMAVALPLGVILAVLLEKTSLPGRRLLLVCLATMLLIPLPLHAAAWRAGFGALGWFTQSGVQGQPLDPLLTGMPGAIWIHGMGAVAWVALIVAAGLAGVDRRLEEDALLTHPAPHVLWRVTLRVAAPSVVVAAGWVLVSVAHEMSVTDLFQVRTFAEEIYTQYALGMFDPSTPGAAEFRIHGVQLAAGLVALAALATAVLWAGAAWLDPGRGTAGADPWRWRPASARRWLLGLMAVIGLLIAGLPVGNLLQKAGGYAERKGDTWTRHWSAANAASEIALAPVRHRREAWQSAKLGVMVAAGSVAAGWLLAPGLVRPGARRRWLLASAAVCLTVPGPLLGMATIRVLNQPTGSLLGPLGWLYHHTLLAPWVVQMVRVTPVAMLLLWPVWQSVPQAVLDAAWLQGDSRWWTALRVRVRAVAAVSLVALALSLNELSATLLVMPAGDTTLTIQLFNMLHSGVDDRVAAISLAMILTTAVLAWAALRLWHAATAAPSR